MATSKQVSESEARRIAREGRSTRVREFFGFDPFDYQAAILDDPNSDVVTTCGRQVGKTETGGAIAADAFISSDGWDVMIAAKWQETADEMLRRAKSHLKNAGFGESHPEIESWNKTEVESSTGGRLYSKTLKVADGEAGDNQRGKLPRVVVLDESAIVDGEAIQQVIRPMFLTHGENHELYLFSTPRGKQGFHYEKHKNDDSWSSHHVPSSANPLIDDDYLADECESVDELTWKQEYLGQFIDLGEVYLPSNLVRPAIADSPPSRAEGSRAWLGVDVARGGHDRTVYTAVDEKGSVFLIASEDTSTMPGVVGRIKSLDARHDFSGILIDENAVGGGVVDFSTEAPKLEGKVEAVTFTTKTKQAMYQGLKKAFEAGEMQLPEHDRLIHELTSLQFDFTQHGKLRVHHPPGGHDDFPDSLALANHGRNTHSTAGGRVYSLDP